MNTLIVIAVVQLPSDYHNVHFYLYKLAPSCLKAFLASPVCLLAVMDHS